MRKKDKIVAMIPARLGSTRLAMKNLALINGKPMVYYVIEAAKQAGVFDKIVLNSEDEIFNKIADRYGVEFYRRPKQLGSSETKSDEVVYDFMQNNPADITAWINSTSPLQSGEEIRQVIEYFCHKGLDSLITVRTEQVHCLFDGQPLNFSEDQIFAQTQDLKPIQCFVYSVMMWTNTAFVESYNKRGHALFCGKTGYFPVSKETSLIVKTEEDLRLIDALLSGKEISKKLSVEYDQIVRGVNDG